jgi:hypothetical protein
VKVILVFIIVGIVLWLAAHKANLTVPRGTKEAEYVRDKSHGCRAYSVTPRHKDWDIFDHKVEMIHGRTYYVCNDDISLEIYDDQVQP